MCTGSEWCSPHAQGVNVRANNINEAPELVELGMGEVLVTEVHVVDGALNVSLHITHVRILHTDGTSKDEYTVFSVNMKHTGWLGNHCSVVHPCLT